MLTMGVAVQIAIDWIGDPGRIIDYGVRFTKPVFVDAREGAVLTVSGKIGEIDTENSKVRLDITAVAADLAVLGKAQAWVRI
jgi:acyl dehydratase